MSQLKFRQPPRITKQQFKFVKPQLNPKHSPKFDKPQLKSRQPSRSVRHHVRSGQPCQVTKLKRMLSKFSDANENDIADLFSHLCQTRESLTCKQTKMLEKIGEKLSKSTISIVISKNMSELWTNLGEYFDHRYNINDDEESFESIIISNLYPKICSIYKFLYEIKYTFTYDQQFEFREIHHKMKSDMTPREYKFIMQEFDDIKGYYYHNLIRIIFP